MSHRETAITFDCGAAQLTGILAAPAQPARTGVVIVVGGPQYRTGSHRQFVHLARALAAAGHASLRFDCRGMGDSMGEFPGFDCLDADIAAAITALQHHCPNVQRVVLWGLCDGASAAVLYTHRQPQAGMAGLVLVNPWLESEQGRAQAVVRRYYWQRLGDKGFWRKLLGGGVKPWRSALDFWQHWRQSRTTAPIQGYQAEMLLALEAPTCPILLVLCSRDATAQMFLQQLSLAQSPCLELSALRRIDFADADHTFSRAEWQAELEAVTIEWLNTQINRKREVP